MSDKDKALGTLRALLDEKVSKHDASSDSALLDLRMADLALDSLEKMELVMKIEEQFNIMLDEEDVIQCEKVSDLVQLIERSV